MTKRSTVWDEAMTLMLRREAAVLSLLKSLEYMDKERQFYAITSHMHIDDLERLAKFQERSGEK